MEPRILDPVPVPVLTLWGLRGLTALDPNLLATESATGSSLLTEGQLLVAAEPVPANIAPAAWAAAAVQLSEAAAIASPAVREAGTQGIIQSFFDELFNHLDPYSRYVPPREAAADRAGRIGTAGAGRHFGAARRRTFWCRPQFRTDPLPWRAFGPATSC